MEKTGRLEVKVDLIRKPLFDSELESPWVLLLKGKACGGYLPIYIPEHQADFIQKLLLDDEPISLDFVLDYLTLPIEQMSKGTLELIVIKQIEGNRFQARLMLAPDDKTSETIQFELPVGNAVALSLITKVPVYVDEALLIHTDDR